VTHRVMAGEAFESVGLKQPCKSLFPVRNTTLTSRSHDPTVPGGDQPCHQHVYC
jgi:hypothetical protein